MKICKTILPVLLAVTLLASCKKNHYDVTNVHGINAQGEVLLPIGSKTLTIMDMMERFQMDSLITCSDDGGLSLDYYYEGLGVLSGEELLRFKDLHFEEHYSMINPHVEIPSFDTVMEFESAVAFQADHIEVFDAKMKSGQFDFTITTNIGVLRRVTLSSPNIKDAAGNNFVMDFYPQEGHFGFNLEGLHCHTDIANSLTFNYKLYCTYMPTTDPDLYIDFKLDGSDVAFREMTGYLEPYDSRNRLDTTFILFPHKLSGTLDVRDVMMRISERNTFGVDARLIVDTALIACEGVAPYSLFDPMPLVVELPAQNTFNEVFNQTLSGEIAPKGGEVKTSSLFIVNASGAEDLITVYDSSNLDVRVDISLPFSFVVNDVQYLDTVNLDLAEIELPDLIEQLTLDLAFNSTLPVDLMGQFYMYDSEHDMITDTLVGDGKLIEASFDGQPTHTSLSFDITEERIEKVMHSDRIIMRYVLDTEAHNVKLNADQRLSLFVKAKAKYNTVVEFND